MFTFFAILAIAIACLGLLGLASFTAEQRTKEIGVRKVLGASISGIVFLLSTEFLKYVTMAVVVGGPMAYFAMNSWLQDFAYRIDLQVTTFVLAGLVSLAIALITVGTQAVRVAIENPIKALKYE